MPLATDDRRDRPQCTRHMYMSSSLVWFHLNQSTRRFFALDGIYVITTAVFHFSLTVLLIAFIFLRVGFFIQRSFCSSIFINLYIFTGIYDTRYQVYDMVRAGHSFCSAVTFSPMQAAPHPRPPPPPPPLCENLRLTAPSAAAGGRGRRRAPLIVYMSNYQK